MILVERDPTIETRKGHLATHPPPASPGGDAVASVTLAVRDYDDLETRKRQLTPYHAKAAYSLMHNLHFLLDSFPLHSFVFVTLTFPDPVTSAVASKRFDSMNRNWMLSHRPYWVGIPERSSRNRLHFHLLVSFAGRHFRDGFDWEAHAHYSRASRNRSSPGVLRRLFKPVAASATEDLRWLWGEMRERLPGFGFGRCEALPVRTNGEAVSRYLSKYLTKHIGQRTTADAGAKSVLACSLARRNTTTIAWNSPGARAWRAAIAELCSEMDFPSFSSMFEAYMASPNFNPKDPNCFQIAAAVAGELSGLSVLHGPRWAFKLYDLISRASSKFYVS